MPIGSQPFVLIFDEALQPEDANGLIPLHPTVPAAGAVPVIDGENTQLSFLRKYVLTGDLCDLQAAAKAVGALNGPILGATYHDIFKGFGVGPLAPLINDFLLPLSFVNMRIHTTNGGTRVVILIQNKVPATTLLDARIIKPTVFSQGETSAAPEFLGDYEVVQENLSALFPENASLCLMLNALAPNLLKDFRIHDSDNRSRILFVLFS